MTDRGMEVPEGDVAEQRRSVQPDTDQTSQTAAEIPLDVDEADAAEQSRAVELDEDEYR